MATFNTPCVVALGISSGKAIYLEVESGKRVEEYVGVSIDSVEPGVHGEFLSGHMAFASFSTTIVKAVAIGKPAYVLDLSGFKPLPQKVVTLNSIKSREFGKWESVWNKPIYLSTSGLTVAIGASRAGSLLHINAVPSDVELAKKVLATAGVLQRAGELSMSCTCRLGLMPYEIFVTKGNRYIVAKFYLNATSDRSKKVFFIAGEGGNVIRRREAEVAEAEIVAYEFIRSL
ncbi:conserved hypothetical protein [Pyrobaculum islandicum DSM 4184]|uniref:Uncharacterized protein n=1 Tax=Pyrobaculum islandicum (strain DSM 4184 / JCM 9189 / GEO3) TaxID=384616 RepID=A1RT21_PYRIL|nr:hypothetical protein [Pyrobaculum islandicum]ABL88103.1 conserved hypothetical protein [Pyrobaculum islandicum DSM 4184]